MDTGVVLRILFLVALAILLFIPTVWSIRDIAYRNFPNRKTKFIWFILVTLLPPLGGVMYILIGRPRLRVDTEE